MFLETNFPNLWFAVKATWLRLLGLKIENSVSPDDRGLCLEVERTAQKLLEDVYSLEPFALHFGESFLLKASRGTALRVFYGRVMALSDGQAALDAERATAFSSWDLNNAFQFSQPDTSDIILLQHLVQVLELAMVKAHFHRDSVLEESITGVKGVLDAFLNRYLTPAGDYAAEFSALILQRQ